MFLRILDKNTRLEIQLEMNGVESETIYSATFYELINDTAFFARSNDLYNDFYDLQGDVYLRVNFTQSGNMYTFTGKPKDVSLDGTSKLVRIEQLTPIKEANRRKYHRYDMELNVRLYGLREADLKSGRIEKASQQPVFSSTTLDISSGGLCVVSNKTLSPEYDPFYIAEFEIPGEPVFTLPVVLLRRGDCPQLALYRYDYGFQFIFDHTPGEMKRLITALFNTRFTAMNR